MADSVVTWNLDTLRSTEAWLRPLVRSLVDDATASDVMQETWLQAWRQPPRTGGALRSWLAQVATNFARSHRRSARARIAREREVTVPTVESTAATVDRLALHRTISAAVAELPEPYRTAVLLRHYHDLDVATIAVRTETSVANVRQRLHRGHDWLRQRLAGELGERWPQRPAVLALLLPSPFTPLAATPSSAPATAVLIAMNKARLLFASVLVFGLLGWLFLSPLLSADATNPNAAPLATSPLATLNATDATSEPVAAEPTERVATSGQVTPAMPPRIAGTTVDPLGRPVAAVAIAALRADRETTATEPQTVADGSGRFELPSEWPNAGLGAMPPWVALAVQPPDHKPAKPEALLVVVPARRQSLRVVDANGAPIAGVTAQVQNFALVDCPLVLEAATQLRWGVRTTDAEGRCHWPQLPTVSTFLAIWSPGHAPLRVAIDASTPAELMVTLQPLVGGRVIHGVVTDARGAVVADARVGLGARRTSTDRYGAFALHLEAGDGVNVNEALHAVAPGWFTAHVARFGARLAATKDPSVAQDLQLTQPVLAISGRVLDHTGKPCANVLVYPWELEQVTDREAAEDLAAPTEVAPWSLCGNPIRAYGRSDAEGKFVVRGLGLRDYRLRVYDEATRWAWTSAAIAAGSANVDVQLPSPSTGPIAGRISTSDGKPAAGVTIVGYVEVYANGGGRVGEGIDVQTTTDAEGKFRIASMPRLGVQISCLGDAWVDTTLELDPLADLEALQITVLRRCHLRVECSGAVWADGRMEVLDAAGEKLYVTERRRNTVMSRQSVDLHEGKTGVLAVSEAAATLVVFTRDGKREHRLPLALRAGEVAEVHSHIE